MPLRRSSLVLLGAGAMCFAVITITVLIHSLVVYYIRNESRENGVEETTNYGRKRYQQL